MLKSLRGYSRLIFQGYYLLSNSLSWCKQRLVHLFRNLWHSVKLINKFSIISTGHELEITKGKTRF